MPAGCETGSSPSEGEVGCVGGRESRCGVDVGLEDVEQEAKPGEVRG